MMKIFRIIPFIFFFTLTLQVVAQEVNIEAQVPDETVAGESFRVNIKITKGSLTGFARFQQNFPRAVNVKPLEMSGADFSFSEGKVNIIWLNLPSGSDLLIQYEVMTSNMVKGDLVFKGIFSYLDNNDRAEIEMTPASVRIHPSPKVDIAQVVNLQDYDGPRPGEINQETHFSVAAFREQPYLSGDNGWQVNLLIGRGGLQKLARIEEKIPAGYVAEKVVTNNAIFSFKGGIAKFLWMTLPKDPSFIVSYKLIPADGDLQSPPEITGIFAFMLENDVKSIPIIQEKHPIHTLGQADINTLIAGYATRKKEKVTIPKPVVEETVSSKPALNKEPTQISEEKPVSTGVYFRVQLLATSHPVRVEAQFAQLKLGKIYKENIEGLYKYTTGSFTQYADARAFVNQLAATTHIRKAFVTAYDNGVRISVKKALSLTNQKWFK